MNDNKIIKPRCKCGGMPMKGVVCGWIIVGMKDCGSDKDCKFNEVL